MFWVVFYSSRWLERWWRSALSKGFPGFSLCSKIWFFYLFILWLMPWRISQNIFFIPQKPQIRSFNQLGALLHAPLILILKIKNTTPKPTVIFSRVLRGRYQEGTLQGPVPDSNVHKDIWHFIIGSENLSRLWLASAPDTRLLIFLLVVLLDSADEDGYLHS